MFVNVFLINFDRDSAKTARCDMGNKKESTDIIMPKRIDKDEIKKRIYEIRGHRVMIDSDIAGYYGVETKALNKAMKRNQSRFPSHFCFQLDKDDFLRFQSGTSKIDTSDGRGGRRYLPYAYTEQGVAMLSAVLHSDVAIDASVHIMDAFVEMTHYLQQNRQLLPYKELHLLSNRQDTIEADVKTIKETMVSKSDLTDLIKLFDSSVDNEEILILDGQPFKADMAYQKIYRKAKQSIIVIDDYLGIKTLQHLAHAKSSVKRIIISDNRGPNPLRQSEYNDYLAEYPDKEVAFIKAKGRIHDRFIILDNSIKDMRVFLCGSSSKDSGYKRITTITELKNTVNYKDMIMQLLDSPELKLK